MKIRYFTEQSVMTKRLITVESQKIRSVDNRKSFWSNFMVQFIPYNKLTGHA